MQSQVCESAQVALMCISPGHASDIVTKDFRVPLQHYLVGLDAVVADPESQIVSGDAVLLDS